MNDAKQGFWKKHLDKFGIAGAVFAALCCLGIPALVSIVGSVGLGFLINDAILLPLLVVFLIVTLGGLLLGLRHHHHWSAVVVGGISAAALVLAMSGAFSRSVIWAGIVGLVVSSVLNVWLRIHQHGQTTATH